MNCEKSTYYKCGEIYLLKKNGNYTFLCYYCDKVLQEFEEFRVHITNCSDILDTSDKQIKLDRVCQEVKNLHKSVETVFNSETNGNGPYGLKLKNYEEIQTSQNFEENFIYDYMIYEDLNEIETNKTNETPCPHCKIFYKWNSHNIKNCSKVQNIITKCNGDFIKLLQEGVLYCYHCKAHFEDYEYLYEHHLKHCLYDNQCKICKFYAFMNSKINSTKQKLNVPIEDEKLKENVDRNFFQINCEKCLKKFISKNDYDFHMQFTHKQSEENENKEKSNESNIVSCADGERKFKCSFCNRLFRLKTQMKTHMRIHTNHRPYKCEFCPSSFTVSSNLKNHIVYKHTNDKPFSCEFEGCNAKFKLFNLKKQHEKRHLPGNFTCEICGKYFVDKHSLFNHQLIHHEDPKNWPFQCQICEKRFALYTPFIEHKRIHTGEKPFGCDVCQKFFRKRKDLRVHKKLHSEKKSYFCLICDKGFKQHAGYWYHMKRYHTKNEKN